MIFRWFMSKTVREACTVLKHYRRLLAAQRDLLTPKAIAPVEAKLAELRAAVQEGHKGRINLKAEELQFAAEKWLKPYPHAAWRENVEVLLVALAVAMAIRTFFLQPFKIPTGSMQPTLFGVTSTPDFGPSKISYWLRDSKPEIFSAQWKQQVHLRETLKIPGGFDRLMAWFHGDSYLHFVAPCDGMIEGIEPPWPGVILNLYMRIKFAGEWHTLWFPPDLGEERLEIRDGMTPGQTYRQGEDVVRLKLSAGDHLFVDRFTYNFRRPQRGEIIVFATAGTEITAQDQFYIKRLTVLPGETVSIGNDRHPYINGRRLDASAPHFANVLGFDPNQPPRESQFSGYLNGYIASKYDIVPVAPRFPDQDTVFTNGPDTLMVFGDNTCNSADSRTWGTLPASNVIGKGFFIYWPLTSRFGVGTTSN